ncbi:MAG: type II toxin-antitoxin system HipA family toxin, partial [Longimicrobiales bacterium]|nr:type II toxin-antitoxin system HipA family toxin [Longimicrobiales bacterium]
MSAPEVFVYTDMGIESYLVGFLWIKETRRGTTASTFQYADSWMDFKASFAPDPLLPLTSPGSFHKDRLFGAIADSAPDRWGRTLMARGEGLRAREEGRAPRHLRDIDYVLGVSDLTRQGALRFTLAEGDEFLAPPEKAAAPPIVELPMLMAAAQGFLVDPDSERELKILLAPGSSLGGARPKASVIGEGGRLSLAKFPKKDDPYSVAA